MRPNQKRLSIALDGDTYKALRQVGVDTERTHQDMVFEAIAEWLARVNSKPKLQNHE